MELFIVNELKYDLVVVGSGPSGQKGAIAAAKLGKRVALVERGMSKMGGVCLHTGTIPSKTIREAILYLTGFKHKTVYPENYLDKRHITMTDLRTKLRDVVNRERHIVRDQLERNYVDLYDGTATFVDQNAVEVDTLNSNQKLIGDKILLAVGTKPSRPDSIPFDGKKVFDSDEILNIPEIPRSMIVIGGGVIGIEYALMFATLGVRVTVVDTRSQLLSFCDYEIIEHLMYNARSLGVSFRLGEEVSSIQILDEQNVEVVLGSNKRLVAETAFFSVGRVGDVDDLNLDGIGVEFDKRGKIQCNENYETSVPNIYAVGDVIGFPSLASTSIEQGKNAVNKIYSGPICNDKILPYGLYTIPEIAMVGKTEAQLTEECVPYDVGIARFEELAKPHIIGNPTGILKLLFHRESHNLLGVHCIGDSAIEIVHLGQAVIHFGGQIDYFCQSVFNHPTISEGYKVAAYDGINRNKSVCPATINSRQHQPRDADSLERHILELWLGNEPKPTVKFSD